eukprot:TRINITY_DN10208_c0_g1_i1.p2 TRINITY_DN10208_c0_g1~~TRINITY_DN10208_c0_g1_i1.p2  ORF type:complete len:119 (+),score=7.41 TRINITY_DN10208_c0_g1_i1:173-529(+)
MHRVHFASRSKQGLHFVASSARHRASWQINSGPAFVFIRTDFTLRTDAKLGSTCRRRLHSGEQAVFLKIALASFSNAGVPLAYSSTRKTYMILHDWARVSRHKRVQNARTRKTNPVAT